MSCAPSLFSRSLRRRSYRPSTRLPATPSSAPPSPPASVRARREAVLHSAASNRSSPAQPPDALPGLTPGVHVCVVQPLTALPALPLWESTRSHRERVRGKRLCRVRKNHPSPFPPLLAFGSRRKALSRKGRGHCSESTATNSIPPLDGEGGERDAKQREPGGVMRSAPHPDDASVAGPPREGEVR